MGCRLDRARDMAIRCVHEAHMHRLEGRESCFVTLTFDDAHLPSDLSVSVQFMQRFHYRLRSIIGPFRFLLCAEYGDRFKRPHAHAIYFGHDFREDRKAFKRVALDNVLYTSPTLDRAWPYGKATIGDFTRETGGYVARYSTKKVGGDRAAAHYRRERINPETGEVESWQVTPEFLLSSRNPGLGSTWFDRYKSDVFPADFLIVDGQRVPVPRYYLLKLEAEEREAIRAARKASAAAAIPFTTADDERALPREEREGRQRRRRLLGGGFVGDNADPRLMSRHEVGRLRVTDLKRPLDAEG